MDPKLCRFKIQVNTMQLHGAFQSGLYLWPSELQPRGALLLRPRHTWATRLCSLRWQLVLPLVHLSSHTDSPEAHNKGYLGNSSGHFGGPDTRAHAHLKCQLTSMSMVHVDPPPERMSHFSTTGKFITQLGHCEDLADFMVKCVGNPAPCRRRHQTFCTSSWNTVASLLSYQFRDESHMEPVKVGGGAERKHGNAKRSPQIRRL